MKEPIPLANQYVDVNDIKHDFGFSFTNEQELLDIHPKYSSMNEQVEDYRKRLHAVCSIFLPLLENLNKDTNKPMIKWPDRKEVLDKQIKKLKELTNV